MSIDAGSLRGALAATSVALILLASLSWHVLIVRLRWWNPTLWSDLGRPWLWRVAGTTRTANDDLLRFAAQRRYRNAGDTWIRVLFPMTFLLAAAGVGALVGSLLLALASWLP
jgi:hypothetical protein